MFMVNVRLVERKVKSQVGRVRVTKLTTQYSRLGMTVKIPTKRPPIMPREDWGVAPVVIVKTVAVACGTVEVRLSSEACAASRLGLDSMAPIRRDALRPGGVDGRPSVLVLVGSTLQCNAMHCCELEVAVAARCWLANHIFSFAQASGRCRRDGE